MAGKVHTSEARTSAIDPLQPLIVAARALAVLVLGTLLVVTVATVFGTGSVLTIGDDPICTTVSAGSELPMESTDGTVRPASWAWHPG